MDVFRKYYDELTRLIGVQPESCFSELAGKLYSNYIITMLKKKDATRKGLMPGAQILMDAVLEHVTLGKKEEEEVLRIMNEVEWLQHIIQRMRDYEPPVVPKVISKEGTDGAGSTKIKVFISYTRGEGEEHMDRVEQLYQKLKNDGSLNVFKDDHVLIPGEKLTPRLKQEISKCFLFVSVMSSKYFDSKWCCGEFKHALEEKKNLFPIVCTDDSHKFKYPNEIIKKFPKLGDILWHDFNIKERKNKATEIAKCALKIIKFINKQQPEN